MEHILVYVKACFRIVVKDMLHLFMVWNICLVIQRHVPFFYDTLFNAKTLLLCLSKTELYAL